MATTVTEEGFDSISEWAVTGSVYSERTGRTGPGGSVASSASTLTLPFGAAESDTVTIGFAWRMGSLMARPLISLRSDAGVTAHITVASTAAGTFEIRRGTLAGTLLATGGTYAINTWYYIEIQVKLHDTTGFAILRVDEVEVASVTNVDTKQLGTKTVFDSIVLTTSSTTVQVWDDLYVVTGADGVFLGDQSYGGTGPFEVCHESFDSGYGSWAVSGGTPSLVAGRNNNGVRLVNNGDEIAYNVPVGQQSNFIIVGFAWFLSANPAATSSIVSFSGSGGAIANMRMDTARVLSLDGFMSISAAGAMPVGVWAYVEVSLFINKPGSGYSAAECEIKVNGVRVGYSRDSNMSSGSSSTISTIEIHGAGSGTSSPSIIDDVYIISGTLADFEGDHNLSVSIPTMKIWDGSDWNDYPVKVWNGSTFVDASSLKIWNGSTWV